LARFTTIYLCLGTASLSEPPYIAAVYQAAYTLRTRGSVSLKLPSGTRFCRN